MAWRRKRSVDTSTSIPLNRLATPSQISSYIKQIVNASQYDYNETESFEVTEVIMNDSQNHGAVLGTFINNPSQEILGGLVLPLMPNISHIPLIGEHVVVVEYNGQHYYTSIINRKNSINENSIPGTVTYTPNTKYGKTFKRKDIRRVHVCEGEIVHEGRFGHSIKLGCNHEDNSPNIKIRVGQQTPPEKKGALVRESIERDGSSIYLLENGLPWNSQTDEEKFDGEQITGKKILIKSDGIFISGRDNIKLRCVNNIKITAPNFDINEDEIKLGSIEKIELQPIVRGDELKSFLNDLLTQLNNVATAMATINQAGGTALTTAVTVLKTKLASNAILSTKVKTT